MTKQNYVLSFGIDQVNYETASKRTLAEFNINRSWWIYAGTVTLKFDAIGGMESSYYPSLDDCMKAKKWLKKQKEFVFPKDGGNGNNVLYCFLIYSR